MKRYKRREKKKRGGEETKRREEKGTYNAKQSVESILLPVITKNCLHKEDTARVCRY